MAGAHVCRRADGGPDASLHWTQQHPLDALYGELGAGTLSPASHTAADTGRLDGVCRLGQEKRRLARQSGD